MQITCPTCNRSYDIETSSDDRNMQCVCGSEFLVSGIIDVPKINFKTSQPSVSSNQINLSPNYLSLSFAYIIIALIMVVISVFMFIVSKNETVIPGVLFASLAALSIFGSILNWKTTKISINKDKISVTFGVLLRKTQKISSKDIRAISCEQNPAQLILKTGTIVLSTAAEKEGVIKLPHLDDYKEIMDKIEKMKENTKN